MSVIIIKNAEKVIISLDPPVVVDGVDIVVTDDKVSAIGIDAGSMTAADKTIDASGCIVHPGLVCSHHHYYSGLSRGITAEIGPTPDFISTLQQLWWRIDRALDEESVYYSSLICSLDAIKAGTTAVIDHHSSPSYITGSLNAVKQGFVETGLRGMTCYEVTNRNNGDTEIAQGVEENIRFAKSLDSEKASKSSFHLVEAAIGGHAPFTISDAGMQLMSDAVTETGRGIHLHIAEDLYDVSVSHHHYQKDLVVRLHDFGLINDRSILVHGLFLSNDDIEILNMQDGFLVHNARSNMNNNVGYNAMLPAVKNLVLGTDGIGADMYEELKFAYFKNRDSGGSFWPPEYLSALSRGNKILERYFLEQYGTVAPGFKADLVISDYNIPTPFTHENLAGHFAFGLGSSSVRTVLINGRIVLENREFPFDVQQIYKDAAKHAKQVWRRMDSLK